MSNLTDDELRVFQLMAEAVRAKQAALFRVRLRGEDRAAIASYARVGGKGRLGVYGLLLSPSELEEVQEMLAKQEYVAPPTETKGGPSIAPVPLPDDADLDDFLSLGHEGYTLRAMCEKHTKRVDASSTGSSDESTDFEEFVNREDGQLYLAVTMMQVFRQDPSNAYTRASCPFCAGEMGQEEGWNTCQACRCAWSEGGEFRRGGEGGVQ